MLEVWANLLLRFFLTDFYMFVFMLSVYGPTIRQLGSAWAIIVSDFGVDRWLPLLFANIIDLGNSHITPHASECEGF